MKIQSIHDIFKKLKMKMIPNKISKFYCIFDGTIYMDNYIDCQVIFFFKKINFDNIDKTDIISDEFLFKFYVNTSELINFCNHTLPFNKFNNTIKFYKKDLLENISSVLIIKNYEPSLLDNTIII